MLQLRFEPMIQVVEREETFHALDHASTVAGQSLFSAKYVLSMQMKEQRIPGSNMTKTGTQN
jgi:hypothetical protein